MSCNFLGDYCSTDSPCCDGFECSSNGVCDFYSFNATTPCPKGYSNVYTSSDSGLCAVDLKTQNSNILMLIFIIVIILVTVVLCFMCWKVYKRIKSHRAGK